MHIMADGVAADSEQKVLTVDVAAVESAVAMMLRVAFVQAAAATVCLAG